MPATNVNWPTPLTRLNPWYPGQMGVPGTDVDTGLRLNTGGKILWVDPNHVDPNDGRDGTNPTSPLATVGEAINQCRPYRGDVIAVMHNGFWTYGDMTSSSITPIAETVVVDVPGVRIVGVAPSGSLGVPWTPTANSDTCITVDALDVLIEGFCFWNSGGYTVTTGVLARWDSPTYYGENTTIRNCFFYGMAYGIQMDYSWNNFVEGNIFQGCSTAAIHNPSVYGEPDYMTIRNNVFTGNAADINLPDCDNQLIEGNRFMDVTAAIVILTGEDNTIHANTIQALPAGVNVGINLTGGASNLVSDNYFSCTIAEYDTFNSDATSGSWVNNHCTNGNPAAPPT